MAKGEFYAQPRGTPEHERRLNIVLKAVFSLIHLPASFIRLWPSCHFDLVGSRHGWGLFLEQTEFLQSPRKKTLQHGVMFIGGQ